MAPLITQRRRRLRRAVFGTIACACFALQPLLVPLHLALHDHLLPVEPIESGDSGEHAHSHAGDAVHEHHRHGHDSRHQGDSDEGHRPHPSEEHFEQHAEPATLPTLVRAVIAPAPAALRLHAFDQPVRDEPLHEEAFRPPPWRAALAPRAPPIVT